jgi:hypothetical protein
MLSKDGFQHRIFTTLVLLLRLSRPAATTTSGHTLHPAQHGVLAHLASLASQRSFKAVRSRPASSTVRGAVFGCVPDRQEMPRLSP